MRKIKLAWRLSNSRGLLQRTDPPLDADCRRFTTVNETIVRHMGISGLLIAAGICIGLYPLRERIISYFPLETLLSIEGGKASRTKSPLAFKNSHGLFGNLHPA